MGPRAIMDLRETEEGVMGGRPIKPTENGCPAWMCLNAGVRLLVVGWFDTREKADAWTRRRRDGGVGE